MIVHLFGVYFPPALTSQGPIFVHSPATLKYIHPCVVVHQEENEAAEGEKLLNEMFGDKEPDENLINEIIKDTMKNKKGGRPTKEMVERKGFQVF